MIDSVRPVLLKAFVLRSSLNGCRVVVQLCDRQELFNLRKGTKGAEVEQRIVIEVNMVLLHENCLDRRHVLLIGAGIGWGQEAGIDPAVTCVVHRLRVQVGV